MPRRCTICGFRARTDVDRELVSGGSIRGISRKFGLSEDALARHKTHVAGALVRAAERREESLSESILSRLETLARRAEKILANAERSGDARLALASLRELRETLTGILTLATKAEGDCLPRERAIVLFTALARAVTRNISDRQALGRILADFKRLAEGTGLPTTALPGGDRELSGDQQGSQD